MSTEIRIEGGANGMERAVIRTPMSEAHVYLHGAHVTHFQPRTSKPVLFMSNKSWFDPTKPIRGGVPICWPWFGNSSKPPHGFARVLPWKVAAFASRDDGSAVLELVLTDSDATRSFWPGQFEARFTVVVGSALEMTLATTNRSSDSMKFEEALHSYFSVSDVRQVKITGLENAAYFDTVGGGRVAKKESAQPIAVTGETDRVYLNNPSTVVIDDAGFGRKIQIRKSGSNSTVLWTPWTEKAKAMPDFGDSEWPGMLCVESANVWDNAVTLLPGRQSRITQTVALV